MSIHVAGVVGLVLAFVIGTTRPINLGAVALVMTFLVGGIGAGEGAAAIARGFPVDLLLLLAGVTYFFGIASQNGTVERVVEGAAALAEGRRAWIPWIVFAIAALPAMAGALGSAGVALLAPLAIRLAERHDIDRRMIGLMVVHGAGAGNFSPLNVLSAIVTQAVSAAGLEMSVATLFVGNLVYNVALAAIAFVVFGGLRLRGAARAAEVAHSRHATTTGSSGTGSPRKGDRLKPVLPIHGVGSASGSIRSARLPVLVPSPSPRSDSASTSARRHSRPRCCCTSASHEPRPVPRSGSRGMSSCSCAAS